MTVLINRTDVLQEFVNRAASAEALALDTEFMRERTYYPELCLIQAATPQEIVLIDPLASLDLQPLQALLTGGGCKILHACRQDLEVLATRFAGAVAPLFDTQLAAALCGHPSQWSYAALVESTAGKVLPKGAQRTDWSRRPLSEQQLSYAADDVRYLADAREQLLERLRELGREHWFDEDMQDLMQPSWEMDPEETWRRVKGYGALAGPALAALRELAAWRERRAMHSNKPRRWIAQDESLLALAQALPGDAAALQSVAGVEPALLRKRAEELLAAISAGREKVPPELDARIPDNNAIKALRKRLEKLAEELNLEASLLATRSDLTALVLDGRCARLERGWRAEIVLPRLTA